MLVCRRCIHIRHARPAQHLLPSRVTRNHTRRFGTRRAAQENTGQSLVLRENGLSLPKRLRPRPARNAQQKLQETVERTHRTCETLETQQGLEARRRRTRGITALACQQKHLDIRYRTLGSRRQRKIRGRKWKRAGYTAGQQRQTTTIIWTIRFQKAVGHALCDCSTAPESRIIAPIQGQQGAENGWNLRPDRSRYCAIPHTSSLECSCPASTTYSRVRR